MTLLLVCMCAAMLPADQVVLTPEAVTALSDSLIVDARDQASFEEGHVAGAAHLDYRSLSEARGGVVGLLKPVDQLADPLARAGIAMDRHIVVYAGSASTEDVTDATRVFWVLEYLGYPRVSVMSGGYAKWLAEGRPVETGPPTTDAIERPRLVPNDELLATREEVIAALTQDAPRHAVVIDGRSKASFLGDEKRDDIQRAGRIPGAVSLPVSQQAAGEHFEIRDAEAVRGNLEKAGADRAEEVIMYCNTGRSASLNYLAARLAGINNVSVYDGSFAEWAATPSCETAIGDE